MKNTIDEGKIGKKHPQSYLLATTVEKTKAPSAKLSPAKNPLPRGTLGYIAVGTKVQGPSEFPMAILVQPLDRKCLVGIEESSIRALAKLAQVMPPRLRRRIDALHATTVPAVWGDRQTVDAEALTAVAQACRDEERLRFSYTAQNGDQTNRHIEPHRLVSLGRRWYLVGFDLLRLDWRSFRLDRLDKPRSTGIRFTPRELPAKDAAAFVRASFGNIATSHAVEALVHAPAASVRSMIGRWATVEEVDEQRCRVRMTVDNLDWPTLALGSVGAEFEVLHPPELAEHIREWGARFTRATYTGTPNV